MKLKNIVLGFFATMPLWMPICTVVGIAYYAHKQKVYLQTRLNEISQKMVVELATQQQLKIGITHFPKQFSVRLSCLHQLGFNGQYEPNTDLMTIDSCIIRNDNETRRVVSHELGHLYVDALNETIGFGNWPNFSNKNFAQQQAIQLVSEGIGEYFERSTHPREDNFKDADWPKKVDEFSILRVRYVGGFHLVKPIIDSHKKAGIEYLITNPPQEKDLLDLPAYQRRALEQLEAKK